MGSSSKIDKNDDEKAESPPLFQSNQVSQIGEQAIIMMEDHAMPSIVELHPMNQSSLERDNVFNTQ